MRPRACLCVLSTRLVTWSRKISFHSFMLTFKDMRYAIELYSYALPKGHTDCCEQNIRNSYRYITHCWIKLNLPECTVFQNKILLCLRADFTKFKFEKTPKIFLHGWLVLILYSVLDRTKVLPFFSFLFFCSALMKVNDSSFKALIICFHIMAGNNRMIT